ncbi:hypothetical protein SDC9_133301 [bioreactor metagenome]|uniref:Uncharacterized protein n=1 Tax=bioreactor metagenome TaxID=1076179 RepID=A0A645DBA9_9ZZZZ
MERTFAPIGVASTMCTRETPSASSTLTCWGSRALAPLPLAPPGPTTPGPAPPARTRRDLGPVSLAFPGPPARATRAGTSDSSTRVVLPEPDTPVTATRRPLGMSTVSGWTVCRAPASRWIRPAAKRSVSAARARVITGSSPVRKPASSESGDRCTSATGPWARIVPPSVPEPGPISTSQDASRRIWTS